MKKMPLAAVFCSAVLTIAFISCSSSPPEVLQIYWQLNITEDTEKAAVYESLSLWVQARDEDGTDDIEYIYLIHDEQELLWEISSETWEQVSDSGEDWYGLNGIIRGDLSNLPRGEYRVVVIDKVGERDERSFYLSAKNTLVETVDTLDVVMEGNSVVPRNTEYGYTIWGFGSDRNFIGSIKDLSVPVTLEEIEAELPGTEYIYVYSYEMNEGAGIIGGPYKLRADENGN